MVLLIKDKYQIATAWKNWRFKSNKDIIEPNLVLWTPSIYEDDINLTYSNFFHVSLIKPMEIQL
jgi:hypothetical protein